MTSMTYPVPDFVGRLQRGALIAGVVGLLACAVGAFVNPTQFFRSYLLAFLFWVGVAVGCLSICLIQHLTGGLWGVLIRRILEAGAHTLRYAWVLFIPLVLGLEHVYVWADPGKVAGDEVLKKALEHRSAYLNPSFFAGRAAFYFLVWSILAHLIGKWSLQQDHGARVGRRLQGLSGAGLLLLGFTITFASVDWAMSLDPEWFSTVYGIIFMVGQALSAMAFVIVMVAALGNEEPFSKATRPGLVHDLGKLMLAFVMLWAYIAVSQFLITWSGNLPEEIHWYIHRLHGGWEWLALGLVVFHFVLPFLLLLSRDLKRNARLLAAVAGALLFVRLVDLFWLVAPDLGRQGLTVHWMDVAAPVGVGGVWLAAFAWQLQGRPLLPMGDPEIGELLEGAEEGH